MNTNQFGCESSGCIEVTEYGEHGRHIRLYSGITGTVCQMTPEEWHGFLADVAAGRWAHIGAGSEPAAVAQ